jgi:exodeoxyribonuclease-3
MPKIISANLNGIRSAHKKGFSTGWPPQDADFVCVQELKAQAPT